MNIFLKSYLHMRYLFNGKNCKLWPQIVLELLAVLFSLSLKVLLNLCLHMSVVNKKQLAEY